MGNSAPNIPKGKTFVTSKTLLIWHGNVYGSFILFQEPITPQLHEQNMVGTWQEAGSKTIDL